ncbi:MAG: cell wall hydrolase [Syntrophomonadaceae bacterium]|nr:cell wall hydrolase [Syntrophomonadaceae bacterium]
MGIKKIIAGFLLSLMVFLATPTTLEALEKAQIKAHYSSPSRGLTLSREEFILLAKLIHAEARGESLAGQIAVGAVVFNRLEDPRFPKTIIKVIYEKDQFSPVADGSIDFPPGERALLAAELALSGLDPTNGCLFFYNPATAQSRWLDGVPRLIRIGSHVFLL